MIEVIHYEKANKNKIIGFVDIKIPNWNRNSSGRKNRKKFNHRSRNGRGDWRDCRNRKQLFDLSRCHFKRR